MSTNDGGAAFPCDRITSGANSLTSSTGMSLRDYFAAKALQGMLADSNGINEDTGKKFSVPDDSDAIAFCCYEMADAMLKARG